MIGRLLLLLLAVSISLTARTQQSPTGAALPSPEEFINTVAHTVVDSSFSHYYLVAGTDSCRFLKYDYDDWIQYRLKEPLSVPILNELSEKVYLSRSPYFWKQPQLSNAVCITRRQADSILRPGQVSAKKNERATLWQHYVFSFSLPHFTDDGQYAVIDLNIICGYACGAGFTCIFRLTGDGRWKLVGQKLNWGS
jgi:hypothetical protein